MMSVTWQGGDNFDIGSDSTAHIQVLAKAIVDYLNTAHLDGVDFDIEDTLAAKGWNANDLDLLLKAIRKLKSDVIITAAPQLNEYDGSYILVSSGVTRDFDAAIENGDFNGRLN